MQQVACASAHQVQRILFCVDPVGGQVAEVEALILVLHQRHLRVAEGGGWAWHDDEEAR